MPEQTYDENFVSLVVNRIDSFSASGQDSFYLCFETNFSFISFGYIKIFCSSLGGSYKIKFLKSCVNKHRAILRGLHRRLILCGSDSAFNIFELVCLDRANC